MHSFLFFGMLFSFDDIIIQHVVVNYFIASGKVRGYFFTKMSKCERSVTRYFTNHLISRLQCDTIMILMSKKERFMDFFTSLDGRILLWIQDNIRCEALNSIFMFITRLGDKGFFWAALAVILMINKRTRPVGAACAAALLLSVVINNYLLKNLVRRARPFDTIAGLTSLRTPHDFSFPSGHTGSSVAAAVTLFLGLPKKYGIPALVLAVLISLSRLYIGVHYPTDVLGGAVTGIGIAFLSRTLVDTLSKKFSEKEKGGQST